jgi:GNAT superfamily N-acetyltransferase
MASKAVPYGLKIRPATSGDVPLILSFIRKLAEYEKLAHEVAADEMILRESLFGNSPGAEVCFAELDGTAVGFAVYFANFSTFLGRAGIYLEDLFVEPAYRGKGIGKALLAYIAKTAVERRAGRLNWAVLDWNQTAIDFYRRMGATVLNEWRICRLTGDALKQLAELAIDTQPL